jgi:hypothetical protein
MKNKFLIGACIAAISFISCNTQKSVDPTGKTPIPVGTDRTVDPDTTSEEKAPQSGEIDSLPDTLMKNNQ